MGDMSNGGPGYGGYGRGPQRPRYGPQGYNFEPPFNPYGPGPQSPPYVNPFGRTGSSTFQWGNGPRYAVPPPPAGMGGFGAPSPAAMARMQEINQNPQAMTTLQGLQASVGNRLPEWGPPGTPGSAYNVPAPRSGGGFTPQFDPLRAEPRSADSVMGQGGQPPPPTGTYSSQGPNPYPPSQPQFTPNQQLMMQSGRGQRGFWQGPTSPYGMQGPYNPYGRYGSADSPQRPGNYNPYGGGGGMQNGAPK